MFLNKWEIGSTSSCIIAKANWSGTETTIEREKVSIVVFHSEGSIWGRRVFVVVFL